ncbi:Transglutaminase-like enzyme, putative cysteine protease [Polaribacter sp. KT25b]|uniref:transglutaminase family protein n=1 Tax=Polaribacter sp. KT25b TaxID=1855336 RepID=UPI00087B016B|nr:transglutaminase family protein [Polaribacter sp. KT25b]SDR93317.1 Transglutaminase-like enzyme, putative cysteine protease [Polaribacter sp. KT25b]
MIFDLWHKTKYSYENGASFCHNITTLKPRSFKGQELLEYKLEISPTPTDISERLDFFGNTVTRFSIQQNHKELIVIARSKVSRDYNLQIENDNALEGKKITIEKALQLLKEVNTETIEARQFVLFSPLISDFSEDIKEYAAKSFKPERSLFEASHELMERIFTDFDFDPEFTTIATPLKEVLKEKKGVCQDFAQIAIACVRSMGLPARYVSGYIETLPPPGKEKLIGTDASHAWFSVFIPTYGWIDFDPTNNQIPKNQHIVVAYGRDYYDVPPLKGVIYSTGKSEMDVAVDLRPAKSYQTQNSGQSQSQT